MCTNLFSGALRQCGLDHAAAARLFGTSVATVNSWAIGRRVAPQWAWKELEGLWFRMIVSASRPEDVFRFTDEGVQSAVIVMRMLHSEHLDNTLKTGEIR